MVSCQPTVAGLVFTPLLTVTIWAKMNIVGCCGWTEAQPKYFAHFGAIEIQSTFYQPPANAVAQRWKAMAPPGFRFCMKALAIDHHRVHALRAPDHTGD